MPRSIDPQLEYSSDERPNETKLVTIDREKTFHCAASKGLVGHAQFTLIPVDPTVLPDPIWKTGYNTRLAFSRTVNFVKMKQQLYKNIFPSSVSKIGYRIKPGSIREVRLKADN